MFRSTALSLTIAVIASVIELVPAFGLHAHSDELSAKVRAQDALNIGREHWKAADIEKAREIAQAHKDTDAGKHLLADVYAVTGQYQDAVRTLTSISSDYEDYATVLADGMIYNLVHLKDVPEAKKLAERLRGSEVELGERELAQLAFIDAIRVPMTVVKDGTFEVPFDASHPYNPWMPVVAGSVNGHSKQLLFDTGGNYLVITENTARELGIEWDESSFFEGRQGPSTSKMYVGIADSLKLGAELELANVPVVVLEEINTGQEMIIFGTTILREFISTVDTPSQKFVFTSRSKPRLVQQHRARYPGSSMEFVMVGDHYMLGKGMYNEEEINMFWDSGLVVVGVVDGEAAQCWMNMTLATMDQLDIVGRNDIEQLEILVTDDVLEFADLRHENPLVCLNSGKMLEFGGIEADALIGYGIQKRYAWTIDFDAMEYVFTGP